ncbi:MAG: EutN/CcmL family microcompartment protein [Myxococcota bacterium]
MRLCRVIGNVVASVKHPIYRGYKLMVVQPIDAHGADTGNSFLAVDQAQAGPGDRVIVMSEGNGVRQILGAGKQVPIRSLIVGIVDRVDVADDSAPTDMSGGRS